MPEIEIIFGPPGTGKTTELINILTKELEVYKPNDIAYVSFTKEGAEQGMRKAIEKFNYEKDDFLFFRTLHSLAFTQLRLSKSCVITKKHYKEFSTLVGMNFTGYYTEDLKSNDDIYLFFDEMYRNNKKTAYSYLSKINMDKLAYVRQAYKDYKVKKCLYDFTDMIEMFNKKNMAVPVKVAFIDEAQDLTTLQWKMIWIAFKNCDKIYIAGDDDQAVYQWSGADVDYFLGVEGHVRVLNKSYRLPQEILDFSKNITQHISKRVIKEYEGVKEKGSVDFINSLEEIQINNKDTYMFLCRNNIFIPEVEAFVRKQNIVYSVKDKPAVLVNDIKAIYLYLDVQKAKIMHKTDEVRLSKYLKKGIKITEPWYDVFNFDPNIIEYYKGIIDNNRNPYVIKVRIATIHSVKGAEADHVILLLDLSRKTKEAFDLMQDTEHRVFYVGCTRAKKTLTIMNSHTKYSYPLFDLIQANLKVKAKLAVESNIESNIESLTEPTVESIVEPIVEPIKEGV
jgi:superfamily I DNA/RNA helicase